MGTLFFFRLPLSCFSPKSIFLSVLFPSYLLSIFYPSTNPLLPFFYNSLCFTILVCVHKLQYILLLPAVADVNMYPNSLA